MKRQPWWGERPHEVGMDKYTLEVFRYICLMQKWIVAIGAFVLMDN